jgi:hypothetical protein
MGIPAAISRANNILDQEQRDSHEMLMSGSSNIRFPIKDI